MSYIIRTGLTSTTKNQIGTYALKLIVWPEMAKKSPLGKKVPHIGRKMQSFYSAFMCSSFRCNRVPYILRNLKITMAKFRQGFRALLKYPENGGNVPDELKNVTFFI